MLFRLILTYGVLTGICYTITQITGIDLTQLNFLKPALKGISQLEDLGKCKIKRYKPVCD